MLEQFYTITIKKTFKILSVDKKAIMSRKCKMSPKMEKCRRKLKYVPLNYSGSNVSGLCHGSREIGEIKNISKEYTFI